MKVNPDCKRVGGCLHRLNYACCCDTGDCDEDKLVETEFTTKFGYLKSNLDVLPTECPICHAPLVVAAYVRFLLTPQEDAYVDDTGHMVAAGTALIVKKFPESVIGQLECSQCKWNGGRNGRRLYEINPR